MLHTCGPALVGDRLGTQGAQELAEDSAAGQDDEVHKELHVGDQLNTGALHQTRLTESTGKKTHS